MLHNTLSALLVSVASRYAKLSPSDVGIGIGGGHLVVDDVQLRTDTLNGPDTPFEILHGRAGRLRVHVPWGALTSSPVKVYLENVHLIASPKVQTSDSTVTSSLPSPPSPYPWYQTNVGRLLFNVSVELYGLKVEYRDDQCVGVLSIASLHAFSAGPDWTEQFVSLDSYEDDEDDIHAHADASAVAMRKSVKLTGVHFVMIPRAATTKNSNPQQQKQPQQQQKPNERNLDLSSFESANPILDGVSIALRVLLCTGVTVAREEPGGNSDDDDSNEAVVKPGMHGEVFVEMDEPSVKLTARQLLWIENILRQALGNDLDYDDDKQQNGKTSSQIRTTQLDNEAVTTPDPNDIQQLNDADASKRPRVSLSALDLANAVDTNDDDITDQAASQSNPDVDSKGLPNDTVASSAKRGQLKHGGRFRSVWDAIVGENIDDTVDDAAIALGLWTLTDAVNAEKGRKASRSKATKFSTSSTEHLSQATDNGVEDEDEDEDDNEHSSQIRGEAIGDGDEDEDLKYARRAVAAAAACGGVSWHVRLRTADTKAWDRVHELERQLEDVGEIKAKLNAAESGLLESQTREQQLGTSHNDLAQRNEKLGNELEELEQMTARAAKNKDEIIRQLQSALAQAQRNLQAFYEEEQLNVRKGLEHHQEMQNRNAQEVLQKADHSVLEDRAQAPEEEDDKRTVITEGEEGETSHFSTSERDPTMIDGSPPPPPPPPFPYNAPVADDAEPVPPPPTQPPPAQPPPSYGSAEPTSELLPPQVSVPTRHTNEDVDAEAEADAGSETGTVVVNEDAEEVPVLGDDTGGLVRVDIETADEATHQQEEEGYILEKEESEELDVDKVVQQASLQSFYNDDNDVNKLEQRMGVQGLTLI